MLTTYTYDRANRLKIVNAGGTVTTYTHDAAGNRTQVQSPSDTTYYTWDAAGRMSSAEPAMGLINFTYNADGQRVAKESNDGSSTGFLYDEKKMLHETDEVGGEITNTYTTTSDQGYGDLISEYGSELYHQFDPQANTNALLDPAGNVQAKYKYYAFGQVAGVSVEGESWSTLSINEWASMSVDAWATLPAISTQLGMGGQKQYYLDTEMQLYLLGSGTNGRYYDANTGRFLSEDPIRQAAGDPNLFLYVQNNPVNQLDPSGHDSNSDAEERRKEEERREQARRAREQQQKAANEKLRKEHEVKADPKKDKGPENKPKDGPQNNPPSNPTGRSGQTAVFVEPDELLQTTTIELIVQHPEDNVQYGATDQQKQKSTGDPTGNLQPEDPQEALGRQLQQDAREDRAGKKQLRPSKDTHQFKLPPIDSPAEEAKFRAELQKAMDPKSGMKQYTPELAEKVLMRLKAAMGTKDVVMLGDALNDPVIQRAIAFAQRNSLSFNDPIELRGTLEAKRASHGVTVANPSSINPADIDIMVQESKDYGPITRTERFMMTGGADMAQGLMTLGFGLAALIGGNAEVPTEADANTSADVPVKETPAPKPGDPPAASPNPADGAPPEVSPDTKTPSQGPAPSTPGNAPKSAIHEANDLGPLQGKSAADIEAQLNATGYTSTKANNGGTIWTKPAADGNTMVVRIDPAMERANPKGFADEVPHVHKEIVPTDAIKNGNYKPSDATKLNDSGKPTNNPRESHIPGGH